MNNVDNGLIEEYGLMAVIAIPCAAAWSLWRHRREIADTIRLARVSLRGGIVR